MNQYEINLIRARARRRNIDFAKNRGVLSDNNLGGFRVWRISDGRVLLGEKYDATAEQVRDLVNNEIDRINKLAGRYRGQRSTTAATA